ncbi:MAG TPA: hypothetical protein VK882_02305 [Nitrososphaeraceae archaeon]|nr:hypothetical protein [Nitrososphaeraceae archaeon]
MVKRILSGVLWTENPDWRTCNTYMSLNGSSLMLLLLLTALSIV